MESTSSDNMKTDSAVGTGSTSADNTKPNGAVGTESTSADNTKPNGAVGTESTSADNTKTGESVTTLQATETKHENSSAPKMSKRSFEDLQLENGGKTDSKKVHRSGSNGSQAGENPAQTESDSIRAKSESEPDDKLIEGSAHKNEILNHSNADTKDQQEFVPPKSDTKATPKQQNNEGGKAESTEGHEQRQEQINDNKPDNFAGQDEAVEKMREKVDENSAGPQLDPNSLDDNRSTNDSPQTKEFKGKSHADNFKSEMQDNERKTKESTDSHELREDKENAESSKEESQRMNSKPQTEIDHRTSNIDRSNDNSENDNQSGEKKASDSHDQPHAIEEKTQSKHNTVEKHEGCVDAPSQEVNKDASNKNEETEGGEIVDSDSGSELHIIPNVSLGSLRSTSRPVSAAVSVKSTGKAAKYEKSAKTEAKSNAETGQANRASPDKLRQGRSSNEERSRASSQATGQADKRTQPSAVSGGPAKASDRSDGRHARQKSNGECESEPRGEKKRRHREDTREKRRSENSGERGAETSSRGERKYQKQQRREQRGDRRSRSERAEKRGGSPASADTQLRREILRPHRNRYSSDSSTEDKAIRADGKQKPQRRQRGRRDSKGDSASSSPRERSPSSSSSYGDSDVADENGRRHRGDRRGVRRNGPRDEEQRRRRRYRRREDAASSLLRIDYFYETDQRQWELPPPTSARSPPNGDEKSETPADASNSKSDFKVKDLQTEQLKEQLHKLQRELSKFGHKIEGLRPRERRHTPATFNDLSPYRETQTVMKTLDSSSRPRLPCGYASRLTANRVCDAVESYRMDVAPPPPLPPPQSQDEAPSSRMSPTSTSWRRRRRLGPPSTQRSSALSTDRSTASGERLSSHQARFPRIVFNYDHSLLTGLSSEDVTMIRREVGQNMLHSTSKRIEEDYMHTKRDFFNLRLNRLGEIPDEANRNSVSQACVTYFRHTPGAMRAIKECLAELELQNAEGADQLP